MHAACTALALLAPAWAALLFRRRIEAWTLWLAYLALQAVLVLLCALMIPELSYLFYAPALAGLIAALLAVRALRRAPSGAPFPPIAAALPVMGAAFTFMPIVLLLYPGLGADAWPVITALSGLCTLGLAPLLAGRPGRGQRLYDSLSTLTVILGTGLALLMPEYSTRMPQRTLLWYVLDADAGRAAWVLQPDSKRRPPQLDLHATGPVLQSTLPAGPVAGRLLASAPRLDYPPPLLDVLSVDRRAGVVRYRLHLRSARNAPEIELGVAEDRAIEATLEPGAEPRLPAHFWRSADGSRWLQLIGVGPEGIDLTLETADAAELALTILDRSYGVPAGAGAQRNARPALTTPSQDGDLTIVYRAVRLSATEGAPGP
jgi:hypothetical protein